MSILLLKVLFVIEIIVEIVIPYCYPNLGMQCSFVINKNLK